MFSYNNLLMGINGLLTGINVFSLNKELIYLIVCLDNVHKYFLRFSLGFSQISCSKSNPLILICFAKKSIQNLFKILFCASMRIMNIFSDVL